MNRRTLSIVMLVPFLALTVWAILNGGLMGIVSILWISPGGTQVFIDLVVGLVLLLTFLIPHARAAGRNPWIWVVLTLFLGSISPLLYFATSAAQPATES